MTNGLDPRGASMLCLESLCETEKDAVCCYSLILEPVARTLEGLFSLESISHWPASCLEPHHWLRSCIFSQGCNEEPMTCYYNFPVWWNLMLTVSWAAISQSCGRGKDCLYRVWDNSQQEGFNKDVWQNSCQLWYLPPSLVEWDFQVMGPREMPGGGIELWVELTW